MMKRMTVLNIDNGTCLSMSIATELWKDSTLRCMEALHKAIQQLEYAYVLSCLLAVY